MPATGSAFAPSGIRDGRMMATWTQGTGDEFIEISKQGWAKGVSILHFLGGISVDLAGNRAIAQTKMTISQRAEVEGVLCDVRLHRAVLRFPRKARRALGHRAAPADLREGPHGPGRRPAQRLCSTGRCSSSFRAGYRHLAYLQTRIGYTVKRDMPGLKGPEVEALYARGAAWLQGKPIS